MKIERTERGFQVVRFDDGHGEECSLQASSAIGDYEDAYERPGTSFVWLGRDGERMHLSREQVADLTAHLLAWLATGKFDLT